MEIARNARMVQKQAEEAKGQAATLEANARELQTDLEGARKQLATAEEKDKLELELAGERQKELERKLRLRDVELEELRRHFQGQERELNAGRAEAEMGRAEAERRLQAERAEAERLLEIQRAAHEQMRHNAELEEQARRKQRPRGIISRIVQSVFGGPKAPARKTSTQNQHV